MKKIVVGISGASGVIIGVRLLEVLKNIAETYCIISDTAKKIIPLETEYTVSYVEHLAAFSFSDDDFFSPVASGTFLFDSMVVVPCSIKSLSAIAMSHADTLIVRAADVTLKEKRRLVLAVRETPFHEGHLHSMRMLSRRGAIISPPVLTFYNNPQSIEDMITTMVGRYLDLLGIITSDVYARWQGAGMEYN